MNSNSFLLRYADLLGICLDTVDRTVVHWLARHGITFLRISVGVIFVWFGALKLIPGASPAEPLIRALMPDFMDGFIVPVIGAMEVAIGFGYITGRFLRGIIVLNLFQMAGAMSPLLFVPGRMWEVFPFVWTLEGQYVVKDFILISAALVIGATVRGGRIVTKTQMMRRVTTSEHARTVVNAQ